MRLHLFILILVMILSKVSCEINGGTDKLSDYRTGQQDKTRDNYHTEHLYIHLKLEKILEKIEEASKPCSLPTSESLHATVEQLEDRFEKLRIELKGVKDELNENRQYVNSKYHELSQDVKDDITKVNEDLNENRQYTISKYHELRQDVNDIYDNSNSKHHELRQDLTDTDVKIQQLRLSVKEGTKISGTTYIRWGRTTCPANGSDVTYTGYAAGSSYEHTGAAASMLCLPEDPDWDLGKYSDANEPYAFVFGAEYEENTERSDRLIGNTHSNQNVPCVVCNVRSRSSHIMVPGKTKCPGGWTMEYYGYLMSGHYGHKRASDYYCIDMEPEDIPGGAKNEIGYLLYFVESYCGSLMCPPYVHRRELPCIVCTK